MGRKILFVTTDQQRYDTLGCNGGALSRTPVVDGLAAEGIRYERAVPQSVVCMPSRSTMLTGQHPSTHGVWMNGVALPVDAPSVAEELHRAGYRTALVGKPHFEPFLDPFGRFVENGLARAGVPTVESPWHDGTVGPHRGFDHLEFATHSPMGSLHYARWMMAEHPEALGGFYAVLDADLEVNADGGGATGAPQVKDNPVERGLVPHRLGGRSHDRLARRPRCGRRLVRVDELPRPAPPVGPAGLGAGPRRLARRAAPRRATPRPPLERERLLDAKPRHWRLWYDGTLVSNYEAPTKWVPATLTADQLREVNARNAIEVELIDEALGRVLAAIAARGWADDLDVVFTTDHGELGGDFGLLFKGPYHVDGLMRLPLIWRPAPSAGVAPATVTAPVGLVDLAPTFCQIADLPPSQWMEGQALPTDDHDAESRGFERVLTEWDSELLGVAVHLRTITRDGWVCTDLPAGRRPRWHRRRALRPGRRPAPAGEPLGRPGGALDA